VNHTIVMGNVGRQPEGLKYTNAGLAVLKFSLADTRGKDDQKKTSWYDVVVFDKQAEAVAEHINKGDRLIVVGRFQVTDYEKKDGTKGKSVELVADEIGLSVKYRRVDATDAVMQAFPGSQLDDEEEF
jgi:single-strand DNA-binding protein